MMGVYNSNKATVDAGGTIVGNLSRHEWLVLVSSTLDHVVTGGPFKSTMAHSLDAAMGKLTFRSSQDGEKKIVYKAELKAACAKLLDYDPKKGGGFSSWKGFRPSDCYARDGIKDLRIMRPKLDWDEEKHDKIKEEVKKEFDELRERKGDGYISQERVQELALKYDHVSGKWMIFTDYGNIDRQWQTLGRALLEGKLPSSVLYLSCNGRDDDLANPKRKILDHPEGKISVITRDFTDKKEVFEVDNEIYKLLQPVMLMPARMKYKPDVYTTVGNASTPPPLPICPHPWLPSAKPPKATLLEINEAKVDNPATSR
jgi:hypothetical protein